MAAVLQRVDVDLSYLSEPEQDQIRAVVERDELLRNELHERIEQLQSDVEHLKQQQQTVNESDCVRCHQLLSLSDGDDTCARCQYKVCVNSTCRLPINSVFASTPGNYAWICILCYKEIELQLVSGTWLYQDLRRHSDETSTSAEAAAAAAVEMEDEIEITQTDEPSTSSPRVNERGLIVDVESPQATDSPAVDHNSVAQEEIEEIVEDYQVDDVDDKLSAHSSALNTQPTSLLPVDDVDDKLSAHSSALNTQPTSLLPVGYVKCRESELTASTYGSQDSIVSAYSDFGLSASEDQHVSVSGDVCFHIIHNSSVRRLEVVVEQCHNLAVVNSKQKYCNPYVKVYLLPDKTRSGKRKTRVIKRNVNPVYEETLTFETDDASSLSSLEKRTVWLAVWHSDRFRSNVFLGDVVVPLHNYEFDGRPTWYPLQQQGREKWKPEMILTHTSELELSLEYVERSATGRRKRKSKTGELHVVIKQAFNLMPVKPSGIVNAFCRIRILSVNRRRNDRHKTAVVSNSQDPEWNQQFTFTHVTLDQLQNCCSLEITVWDYERFTTSNFLGAVRLNSGTEPQWPVKDWKNAEGDEMDTWQKFVNEQPETVLDARLQLRND